MENNKHLSIKLISLLALLVVVTAVFVIAFTFAGDPEAPDAIVTYTQNKLSWNVHTNSEGIADLDIFGDPQPGEEYPLIHPGSKGTYYLRLKNDVSGNIGYTVFLYTNNTHQIPLVFNVANETQSPSFIPDELNGKQIVSSFSGDIDGRRIKNFEINWEWNSSDDESDTELGNKAVTEDLIYDINALIIIEDNNPYYTKHTASGVSGVILYHSKYVNGYVDDTFKPENNIARSEVAAIFARIMSNFNESSLTKTQTKFTDISNDSWCVKYIASLADNNIVNGYEDGTFKPVNPITRAEFTAICMRYFELKAGAVKAANESFTDVNNDHWAYSYIAKAQKQGFVTGYTDGTFKPDEYITRAEAVAIINRILSRYPDKNYIDENTGKIKRFTDVTDKEYWAYYDIYEAANTHYARIINTNESWQGVE